MFFELVVAGMKWSRLDYAVVRRCKFFIIFVVYASPIYTPYDFVSLDILPPTDALFSLR